MPSEKAIELAAQAWCQKETSCIEMDSRLAMAFACIIDRVALQESRSGGERTTNSAMDATCDTIECPDCGAEFSVDCECPICKGHWLRHKQHQ